MGQNKFENQISEKLNAREIQPSAQAWDRLDAMLTVAEEKKTRRSYGWLYIAASVLVFASLGLYLFNQKDTTIQPQNSVVETGVKNETNQQNENQIEQPIIESNQQNQVAVATDNKKINQSSNNQVAINQFQSTSNTHPERTGKNQKPTNSNQNPLINREKEIQFQNSSDVAIKDLPKTIESRPIVVDNHPKTQKPTLSDEQLLAGLDNVAKQSTSQKSSIKIDAKSLLSQADGEVEMTFREKVINKISKNYKEVKVALANRNNE